MKRNVGALGVTSAFALAACQGLVGLGDPPYLVPNDAGLEGDGESESSIPDAGESGSRCIADAADFWVKGTSACSFDTITAAIAAARGSHAALRTVHVAPGIYSAATGETLPLDVRDGISLVGEGSSPSDTVIQGSGALDHTLEGGELPKPNVTIAVGAASTASRIANMRLLPGVANPDPTFPVGILCDRGNTINTLAATQNAPNTAVDGVIFESGYATGILVSHSVFPMSGCNLRLTSSLFNAAWDKPMLRAVEVGNEGSGATPLSALQVGDGDPGHGNTFNDLGDHHGTSHAVSARNFTASLSIHANTFHSGEEAIHLETRPGAPVMIDSNTFDSMSGGALVMYGAAVVQSFSGNTIKNGGGSADASIWLKAGNPQILRARKNTFDSNHIGVKIDTTITGIVDFGRPGDDGANIFGCSAYNGKDYPGYDFGQFVPVQSGALITAYGNTWDHSPPVTAPSSNYADGTDVVFPPSGALPNIGGGTSAIAPCSTGNAR